MDFVCRKKCLFWRNIMAFNIDSILTVLLAVSILLYLTWWFGLPIIRARKFRNNGYYKTVVKAKREYYNNVEKPNQESRIVKGNKLVLKEKMTEHEYKTFASMTNRKDEKFWDYFIDLIAKHIKDNEIDIREYIECVDRNKVLLERTNNKVIAVFKKHGLPDKFEMDILMKDTEIKEEQFCVVLDIDIDYHEKVLNDKVDLPYECLKMAYEKYLKVS
jgi:hypothetical protein